MPNPTIFNKHVRIAIPDVVGTLPGLTAAVRPLKELAAHLQGDFNRAEGVVRWSDLVRLGLINADDVPK